MNKLLVALLCACPMVASASVVNSVVSSPAPYEESVGQRHGQRGHVQRGGHHRGHAKHHRGHVHRGGYHRPHRPVYRPVHRPCHRPVYRPVRRPLLRLIFGRW